MKKSILYLLFVVAFAANSQPYPTMLRAVNPGTNVYLYAGGNANPALE